MTSYYWDTSALLALIFEEPDSGALARLAEDALPGYTSFFTFIEMESAYSRRIAQGVLKGGSLPGLRMKAQRLESSLGVLWADQETMHEARRLVLEQGLRPGDALQLASALLLQRGSTFVVSLDQKLRQAAQAVGLSSAL